jgi:hypothetical protein
LDWKEKSYSSVSSSTSNTKSFSAEEWMSADCYGEDEKLLIAIANLEYIAWKMDHERPKNLTKDEIGHQEDGTLFDDSSDQTPSCG